MQYMPSNLADKFKNLVAIRIRQGKLNKVSQNDFKSFPKLRYLNLDANDLEVLDDDLFQFNPLLEVIWFEGNKIKAIGQSTFDNLKNLRVLDMNGNNCFQKRMSIKYEISTNLATMKQRCYNSDVELSKLKLRYRELNTNNSKLILDIDELNSQISQKDKEIESMANSVYNLTEQSEKDKKYLQAKLVQLQEKFADEETKSKFLDSQLKQSNLKNHEILDQMTKLEEKHKTALNQTAQIEKSSQERINKLQQEIDEKDLKYQDLIEKFNNSQLLTNKTHQTLEGLQAQLRILKQIESELRQNVSQLEQNSNMHHTSFKEKFLPRNSWIMMIGLLFIFIVTILDAVLSFLVVGWLKY